MTQTAREVQVRELDPKLLLPNPWDPRSTRPPEAIKEMADSIRQVGLLQNLVVRPVREDGNYEIAFGKTRLEAVRLLQQEGAWPRGIPCEVRDLSDAEMALVALTENSRRTDLTPLEKVRAYQRALSTIPELNITSLAEALGLDRSTLSNQLRLLKLPSFVLNRVDSGEMSAHAAREFLCLMAEDHAHEEVMERVVKDIANTPLGHAPDWRSANIRRLIRDFVSKSTVDKWRRLGTFPGKDHLYDYGSSHRTGPSFDVTAFEKDQPQAVHMLPWDVFDWDEQGRKLTRERTLAWTCKPKEWERRQAAANRQVVDKATGVKPTPKKDTILQQTLQKDPVAMQIVRQASKQAAAAGVSTETAALPAKLTAEHMEKLGSRAKPVKLNSGRGFYRSLDSHHHPDLPSYFPDPDDCRNCCTNGATYAELWGTTSLYCLNKKCWEEKEARGKAEFTKVMEAQVQQDNAQDLMLAQSFEGLMTGADNLLPAMVARGFILSVEYNSYCFKGLREFRYEPATLTRIAQLLHLKPNSSKETDLIALKAASPETLREVAGMLLAYAFRTHDPKSVGELLRKMK